MRRASQNAVIRLRQDFKEAFVKIDEVKIVWKINKRARLVRCFRYIEYEHSKGECKWEDRSNMCINYAQTGHATK